MIDSIPNCGIENDVEQAKVSRGDNAEELESMPAGIVFDGRYYRYKSYRYDRLADACDYARRDPLLPASVAGPNDHPKPAKVEQPTEVEWRTITDLNITFDGKCYRYKEYRYDHFADAVIYAQLKQRIRPGT
jgi:hypothetical protein